MKNLLVKGAVFCVNKLIKLVDKLLVKKPQSETLLKAKADLSSIKDSLLKVKF